MATPFFCIEMLPAGNGDCLWIEYGQGEERHRLLIDGGRLSTFPYIKKRIDRMPEGDHAFDLIVLTHVDADHIEGLVRLFAEKPLPFAVDQVWFNGWRQMKKSHGLLGPLQGEFLSALLVDRTRERVWNPDAPPWVVTSNKALPTCRLRGGMQITLLSPTPASLEEMAKVWEPTIRKEGFQPGDLDAAWDILAEKKRFLPTKGLLGTTPNLDKLVKAQFLEDEAAPNGSSIAFLAEYEERSALFLADAHPPIVEASIRRLCKARHCDRLCVDAVKVAHHGSKHNTSPELLKLLCSPSYLISTNGVQFKHPHEECLARILRLAKPKRLYFNYRTEFTKPWLTKAAQEKFHYQAVVRANDALSLKVPVG